MSRREGGYNLKTTLNWSHYIALRHDINTAGLEHNKSKSAFRNLHKSILNHLDFLAKKPVKVTESSCPFSYTISKSLWALLSALFVFSPHLERSILIGKSLSRLHKSKTVFHTQDDFSQLPGKRTPLKISQTRTSNNLDQQLGKSHATSAHAYVGLLRGFTKNMRATGRGRAGMHWEGSEEAHEGSASQCQHSLWSWRNWRAPKQAACWEARSRWRDSSGLWRLYSALLQYPGSHWGSSCFLQFIKAGRQNKAFAI